MLQHLMIVFELCAIKLLKYLMIVFLLCAIILKHLMIVFSLCARLLLRSWTEQRQKGLFMDSHYGPKQNRGGVDA